MGQGVRTPGVVQLPICTPGRVFSEAREILPKAIQWSLQHGTEYDGGTYPCGEGILTADEMAAFGFK